MPTRVHWGRRWFEQLGELTAEQAEGPVAVITGSAAARKHGYTEQVCAALTELGCAVFDSVEPEPSHATVMAAKHFVEENGLRGVVALGGGSVIDAAKAVCCLAYTDADIGVYMDRAEEFSGKQIPLIALPTTAGTGSAVTPFSVLTDEQTGSKKSLPSPYFYPEIAVIVPEFLSTVPQKVIGDVGLDALAHAYEALWSMNSNAVSDALAFKAIKLIGDNLSPHYVAPTDIGPAMAMAEGSTLAGMAFSNTFTAGCHALSYPIARIFHLSHGAACAITLDLVAAMNAEAVDDKFELLAEYLGLEGGSEVPDSIRSLRQTIPSVPTLRRLGASQADLEEIAEGAFEPLLRNNPVPMTKQRIIEMLEPEIA